MNGGRKICVGLLDTIPQEFYLSGEDTDPQKFITMFENAGLDFDYRTYLVAEGEIPDELDECDAYLITGSPCSVYEDLPWIPVLEDFVRTAFAARKPQVGVCFGHQIAAQALGGRVQKARTGWLLGRYHLLINVERPWMSPTQNEYTLHYINQDQVLDLPPGVELLGESARCPNAMYTVDGALLCIQPHPEQSKKSMQVFTDHLLHKGVITAEEHSTAHETFDEGQPDSTVVARWLGQFIDDAVHTKTRWPLDRGMR